MVEQCGAQYLRKIDEETGTTVYSVDQFSILLNMWGILRKSMDYIVIHIKKTSY